MIGQLLDMWENKVQETTEVFRSLGESRAREAVAPGKNRVIYLLGHLLVMHDGIFETLELGGRTCKGYDELFLLPQHAANQYPSYHLLLEQWIALNKTLTFKLRQLSPQQWRSKHRYISEADFESHPNKNRFCGFQCLLTHLYHHAGQLALIRL